MELCYDLSISSPIPGTFTDAENLQLQGFRVYMSSGLPRMALEVTEDNLPPDGMLMTKWGEEKYVAVGDYYIFTKTLDEVCSRQWLAVAATYVLLIEQVMKNSIYGIMDRTRRLLPHHSGGAWQR